ncbi:MAG: type III-B CRISPR module RAMP protein Cmr1 [Chloroflexi bacterium]|nr:type III-B CRISPR module RAMP protein Cmr1 [Chloroflexota bacterium]
MAVEIDARFLVTTPLFGRGADDYRPELRLPSFKGVLRFWWRALAWSRLQGDLAAIRQEEDALFGSAGGGQSRLSMRLTLPDDRNWVALGDVLRVPGQRGAVGEGARYLGYGVMEAFASRARGTQAGQLIRACLAAPFEFTVRMRARALSDEEIKSVRDALVALGTLGSMGSRSRKGYGSLSLASLLIDGEETWRAPTTISDLNTAIGDLPRGAGPSGIPEYTALTPESRHILASSAARQPLELLDLVGRELVRYRSWGRDGKILGNQIDSERRFRDDHDLMKGSSQDRKAHPRRVAFGLPHNYGPGAGNQVGPAGSGLDRRASPLFIHIHQCEDTPVAVISFLPSRFLPSGTQINVGGQTVPQAPEPDLYQPIHDFLNRLLDPAQRREPFIEAVEV